MHFGECAPETNKIKKRTAFGLIVTTFGFFKNNRTYWARS
jgi:hypothetical protein